MKKIIIFLLLVMPYTSLLAQSSLTIEDCQAKAREHYPLIKRQGLIDQTKDYTLANAGKAYLPQFSVTARASYQSEVTSIPITVPGVEALSKDQYLAAIDMNQTIWDGGNVHALKKITQANAAMEQQQLEVDLYALEKRINQLFFGILLFDAQLEQHTILQDNLHKQYATVDSYEKNGIANQADLDAVKVELLKSEQTAAQIKAGKTSYMQMLAAMIGEPVDEQTTFAKPAAEQVMLPTQINRPELQLFDAQTALFESQKSAVTSSYLPKVSLFLQGGYGRPGLNMLSNNFDPFYIGGIRLNWNFGGLYTQKNERRKLDVNQNSVEVQRETFLYNTNLQITQDNSEIKKLKELMQYDDEIITLRENVRKSAEAKVANGTLTVIELMREVNAENLARQEKTSHEIQLLMAIYNLKNTTNN